MKSKKFILWVRTIIISCEKDLSLLNLYSCYFILDLCLRKKATSKQRECNYWRHDDDNIIWIGLSIVKVVTAIDFAHFWRRFPMQAVIEDTNFSLFRVAAHFWKKYWVKKLEKVASDHTCSTKLTILCFVLLQILPENRFLWIFTQRQVLMPSP